MRSKFLLLNILIYIPIILIGQVNTDDYRLSIQKKK